MDVTVANINARLDTLQAQRNDAMDKLVTMAGNLADALARIAELEAAAAKKPKRKVKADAPAP